MTTKPFFSIVTVCFNCLDDLKSTIKSVKSQNSTNYEYIVVDGDSSDGTKEWLTNESGFISHLVSEKDNGIYDAMNKGISLASGEYIYFLNAGDRFTTNSILSEVEAEINKLDAAPSIYTGRIQFSHKNKPMMIFRPKSRGPEGPGLPHQATFVNLQLQRSYPFNTLYKFVGDYDIWRRMQADNKFDPFFSNSVIAFFEIGGASTESRNDFKRYFERSFVDYSIDGNVKIGKLLRSLSKPLIRMVIRLFVGEKLFFIFLRALK